MRNPFPGMDPWLERFWGGDLHQRIQQPLNLAYEKGRYAMRIDYARPAEPPLSGDDAAWTAQVLDDWRRGGRS